jgi:hypothetical protein
MDMATKPGWKTSELYVVLVFAAALQWAAAHGHGSPDFANLLTMLSGVGYTLFRQFHKGDAMGQLADAAQAVVPGIATAADLEAVVSKQLAAHQAQILGLINTLGNPAPMPAVTYYTQPPSEAASGK